MLMLNAYRHGCTWLWNSTKLMQQMLLSVLLKLARSTASFKIHWRFFHSVSPVLGALNGCWMHLYSSCWQHTTAYFVTALLLFFFLTFYTYDTRAHHICWNFTYILSLAEDALVSAIIFLTFCSSRLNFTVTSSYSGPCSGFHHLGHFK